MNTFHSDSMFWTYKTILYIKTQLKYYTVTVCTLGWDEITLNLVRTKKFVSFQRDPDVEKFRYRRTGWVNCKRVVLFLTQYKYGFVSMYSIMHVLYSVLYSIMHVLYSVLYNPLCSGTLWQKRRAWWRVDKTKRQGDALKNNMTRAQLCLCYSSPYLSQFNCTKLVASTKCYSATRNDIR